MLDEANRRRLTSTRFRDVRWFEAVGSTNDWVLQQARVGAGEGLVAVADHQTAGRGRRDRSWTAPAGSSLLTSILLRPELPPDRLQLATAAVSLSAADACERVAGVRPELKWPNDLLVAERKLAGILAEADIGTSATTVVVGLGLNVNWPEKLPATLAATAVSLNHVAGGEVDRADLLTELLVDLDSRVEDWEAVASDYRDACATLGRRVLVDLGEEKIEGEARGLLPDGRLEVVPDGGEPRVISAADVVHLRPS